MPARIQRKRVKGWRAPEGAVYVGRGSRWGNPFKVGTIFFVEPGSPARGYRCINSNEDAAYLYRYWLKGRYKDHPELPPAPEGLVTLAGKDLMCWCPADQPCHADVLLELANKETP